MNKHEANTILEAMNEMLVENFPEFDVKFGNTKFNPTGKISIQFDMIERNKADELNLQESEIGMRKNGVHPDALGKVFRHTDGDMYEVISVNKRKMKYAVLATQLNNGKNYKFQPSYINDIVGEITGNTLKYYMFNGSGPAVFESTGKA